MKEYMLNLVGRLSNVPVGFTIKNELTFANNREFFDSLEEAYKAVREHMEYMKDLQPREQRLVVVSQRIDNNSDKYTVVSTHLLNSEVNMKYITFKDTFGIYYQGQEIPTTNVPDTFKKFPTEEAAVKSAESEINYFNSLREDCEDMVYPTIVVLVREGENYKVLSTHE